MYVVLKIERNQVVRRWRKCGTVIDKINAKCDTIIGFFYIPETAKLLTFTLPPNLSSRWSDISPIVLLREHSIVEIGPVSVVSRLFRQCHSSLLATLIWCMEVGKSVTCASTPERARLEDTLSNQGERVYMVNMYHCENQTSQPCILKSRGMRSGNPQPQWSPDEWCGLRF